MLSHIVNLKVILEEKELLLILSFTVQGYKMSNLKATKELLLE